MDQLVNLTLIKITETVDDIGEPAKTETSVTIRGTKQSVTRDEWFSAYKADIQAKYRIKVYEFEYHDETEAILNGERLAIYRTFYNGGDYIELYLGKKGGVQ